MEPTNKANPFRDKGKDKARVEEKGNRNGRFYQDETNSQSSPVHFISVVTSLNTQNEASSSRGWIAVRCKSRPKQSPLFTSRPNIKLSECSEREFTGLTFETQSHIFSFVDEIKNLCLLRQVCKNSILAVENAIINRAIQYGFTPQQTTELSQQRVCNQIYPAREYLIKLFKKLSFLTPIVNFQSLDKNKVTTAHFYKPKYIKEKVFQKLPQMTFSMVIYLLAKLAEKKSNFFAGFLGYLLKNISMDDLWGYNRIREITKLKMNLSAANNKKIIHSAIKNNHLKIIEFLFCNNNDVINAIFEATKSNLKKCFEDAVSSGHIRIINFFLGYIGIAKSPPSLGQTSSKLTPEDLTRALAVAVRCQLHQPELIRELVKLGANVSFVDDSGDPLLYRFDYKNWNASIEESVEYLLTQKQDLLSQPTTIGLTTLHAACHETVHIDAIKYLLKKVDPNHLSSYGTALHFLIQRCKEHPRIDVIQLFLENGANLDLRDGVNLTVFDYVILYKQKDVLQFFLQQGVNPNRFIQDTILWQKSEIFSSLIEDPCTDINKMDANGFSPLGLAKYVQKFTENPEIEEIIRLLVVRNAEEITPPEKKLEEINEYLVDRLMLTRYHY